MTNNILVYVETLDNAPVKNSLEALSAAVELKEKLGGELIALVIDTNKDALKKSSADKVITVKRDNYNVYDYSNIIKEVADEIDPKVILFGATLNGKELAPFTAAKYDTVVVNDATEINYDNGEFNYVIGAYGGTVLTRVKTNNDKVQIITLRAGSVKVNESLEENKEEIEKEVTEKDIKAIVKEVLQDAGEAINLEDAEVIITVGRGACDEESLGYVKEMAEVLGASLAGTRPVIEDGIMPRSSQLGQSGKIVSPKLYIGCGVSGAVQHISGVIGSDFIIAINKDEDASIFEYADVGIVGDCKKVFPLLTEEFKKLK